MKDNFGFTNFRQSLEFKEFSKRLPLEFNAPINAASVNEMKLTLNVLIIWLLLHVCYCAPRPLSKKLIALF